MILSKMNEGENLIACMGEWLMKEGLSQNPKNIKGNYRHFKPLNLRIWMK